MPDQIVKDRVKLGASYLVANPPPDVMRRFTIKDGYIIDGPRPTPGDSIDFSALLTNSEVHRAFMAVAFGGGELAAGQIGWEVTKDPGYRGETLVKLPAEVDFMIFVSKLPIQFSTAKSIHEVHKKVSEHTGVIFQGAKERRGSRYTIVYYLPIDRRDSKFMANSIKLGRNNDKEIENKYLENVSSLLRKMSDTDLNCFIVPFFYNETSPSSAHIFIKTGDNRATQCFYEEIVQAMGLYRDDNSLISSSFTDAFKHYTRPTELDWLLLKVLYDPRLKNGMTRGAASPIVRTILSELRPYAESPPRPGS